MAVNSNYVSDILDEIALEGLDGITTEDLFKRLSARPNFCIKIDNDSKKFIWNIVRRMSEMDFYEIPEARQPLQYYDAKTHSDQQNAICELEKLYPYVGISEPGVFGSCEHYYTRINVTQRVQNLSLEEVTSIWGSALVLVASQDARFSTLLGNHTSPQVDFSKTRLHYIVLERIGRSRYLGLPTYGKGSLLTIIEDSKSIFHYLKFLINLKVVKKQSLFGSLHSTYNCSKVHLTRFFGESYNECQLILQTAIEELKSRPNCLMSYDDFYNLFEPEKRKRVRKYAKTNSFRKYITLSKGEPYRYYFPNAKPSEWERKSKNGEKIIRCFQLKDPTTDVSDILYKDLDQEEDGDDSEFLVNGIYYRDMPVLRQAYLHIKNAGSKGLTNIELQRVMGITNSFVRSIIKRLIGGKYCSTFVDNDGRKRCNRYVVGENKECQEAASEIAQILNSDPRRTSSETAKDEDVVADVSTEKKIVDGMEEAEGAEKTEEKEEVNYPITEGVSYRELRRIALIIKTIKAHRHRLFHQISNFLVESEIQEGLTARIDRHTVRKLLSKLEKDNLIKKVVLKGNDPGSDQEIKLYVDPTFTVDDKLAERLLHTHTSTYQPPESTNKNVEDNLDDHFSSILIENLLEMKKMLKNITYSQDKLDAKDIKETEAVYCPKFVRLNILHDLIFYLVYDYSGITDQSQEELLRELSKTCAVDDELKSELPVIYGTQLSHYLFIPPLTSHKEKRQGWFVMSDLLTRMPLSQIVKLLRIGETPPELLTYLHHPVKKHFLVKDLPLNIREMIFNRKQVMISFYNDMKRLCFLGLLKIGSKFGKEYYQTMLHLNRKATLLDTRSSPEEYFQVPADMEFPKKSYEFNSTVDIKSYWLDMFNICLGTNLGIKTSVIGKEILTEREMSKESLKKCLDPINLKQGVEMDDGTLPGDHRGAAGIDSVMFSFLKTNWIGPYKKIKEATTKKPVLKSPLPRVKREHPKRKLLLFQRAKARKLLKTGGKEGEKAPFVPEVRARNRQLRMIRKRENRFKRDRKVAYDEVDMEALKLMSTLRVTWSTAEDNLLLICRVAMMYLCPNHRTFVRIPWVEVRRVLQENLPESRNKTQKAIARRIVYMLKNPTTVRSVSLCLEELRQVPELTRRFECSELLKSIKPSAPNLEELQAKLYKRFHELVRFMKDRFIDGASFGVRSIRPDLIPDSFTEFLEQYELPVETDEEISIKSIREDVIRAILMSSLSTRSDKTSCGVQLFEIYRQYEEDELQNAMRKLHNDKVITINKRANSAICLPLAYSPYQLSHSFQHMLSMKYMMHEIYSESYCQISKLKSVTEERFEVDLNECNIALFLLACKNIVSFITSLPEQIIILDARNRSDADYSKMLDRYCEMLKFSNINSKFVCTSGKILSRANENNSKEADSDEPQSKRLKLDDDCVPTSADISNNESNSTEPSAEGSDGTKGTSEGDQPGTEKTKNKSSRIVLYMMREEANKEITKESNKLSQEYFAVNASKVSCTINSEDVALYVKNLASSSVTKIIKNIIKRSLVPLTLVEEDSIYRYYSERGYKENEMNLLKNILMVIYNKKEFGVTNKELRDSCSHELLPELIKELLETKIIIKTGLNETRYVGQKYCTPWLLNSFKLTRLEREKIKPNDLNAVEFNGAKKKQTDSLSDESSPGGSRKKRKKGVISMDDLKSESHSAPTCSFDANNKVKIILRPWIRIDGTLNRKVLDRFLGTILGFIMVNPGASIKAIVKKFVPSITPAWTKDLIEILHEISCVNLTPLIVKRKPTLFHKGVVDILDKYTGLEDDESVAVEAEVDAIAKLGLFIGNKTYSKDFLAD